MAVTLQQIAEKAGVSRGTVDRALNNRGRIRPEVAENIRRIADEMGYRPNRAGKALALTNRQIRIGVVLQEVETPFMQELIDGVVKAKEEIEYLGGGVIIKEIKGINTKAVMSALEELREAGVKAIAINPAMNQTLKETIVRYVKEYEIPIVTFNTDIPDSGRLCYFGQDAYQCGRMAAGLLGLLLGTMDRGKTAVISGYESNPSLNQRCEGFRAEMQERYPEREVLPVRYTYNSNAIAETVTLELLEKHADLQGIFVTSSNEEGVCKALEKAGKIGSVKVVIADLSPGMEVYLEHGDISFAIVQNAQEQSYQPIMMLFELLFDGKVPEKEYYYTTLTILTRYNLPARPENPRRQLTAETERENRDETMTNH